MMCDTVWHGVFGCRGVCGVGGNGAVVKLVPLSRLLVLSRIPIMHIKCISVSCMRVAYECGATMPITAASRLSLLHVRIFLTLYPTFALQLYQQHNMYCNVREM